MDVEMKQLISKNVCTVYQKRRQASSLLYFRVVIMSCDAAYVGYGLLSVSRRNAKMCNSASNCPKRHQTIPDGVIAALGVELTCCIAALKGVLCLTCQELSMCMKRRRLPRFSPVYSFPTRIQIWGRERA